MCLQLVLMPGAARLPKSHSQLHEKASPAVAPTGCFRSLLGQPFPAAQSTPRLSTAGVSSGGSGGSGSCGSRVLHVQPVHTQPRAHGEWQNTTHPQGNAGWGWESGPTATGSLHFPAAALAGTCREFLALSTEALKAELENAESANPIDVSTRNGVPRMGGGWPEPSPPGPILTITQGRGRSRICKKGEDLFRAAQPGSALRATSTPLHSKKGKNLCGFECS